MLKRLFTPLTLVHQLALIVLAPPIVASRHGDLHALVNGTCRAARTPLTRPVHCVCKATTAAGGPLNENDQKLVADMTATVFQQAAKFRPPRRQSSQKPCSSTAAGAGPGCSARSIRRKWPRMSPTLRRHRPVGHRIPDHTTEQRIRTGGLDPSHPRHWYGAAA